MFVAKCRCCGKTVGCSTENQILFVNCKICKTLINKRPCENEVSNLDVKSIVTCGECIMEQNRRKYETA